MVNEEELSKIPELEAMVNLTVEQLWKLGFTHYCRFCLIPYKFHVSKCGLCKRSSGIDKL